MATRLKDTDVVIIGLGAAGGVAALPLAQAGLEVIGLEAGTWLTRRDFAPDELRNNYRGWPQAVQKANQEIPTSRATASAPTGPRGNIHPMQNGVGGTTLHYWAQSWRLNPWDFKVVSETKRRYGASRIPKGSTVEDWPFGYDELEPYYDKIEYEVGISGQAGNINGTIDPRGNPFEGPRKRDYPMPPLRGTAFIEKMTAAAKSDRLASVPRSRRDQLAHVPEPLGLHVSRLLQPRRLPRRREELDGGDDDSARAGDRAPQGRHPRARDDDRGRTRNGRMTGVNYVTDGVEYFQPAKVVLLASFTYENTRLLLLSKSKAFPNGLSNNHKQVGRHYFSHHQGAPVYGAVSVQPRQLVRPAGAGRRGRQLGRRQLRSRGPRLHRRRQSVGDVRQAADRGRRHEHVRPRARLGLAVEGVHQGERRSLAQLLHPEDDAAVRGQLPRSRSGREGSARLSRSAASPAEFKENERKIAAFSQDKMEQWYREAGAIAVQRAPVGGAMGVSTHAYGGTRMGDNPETNVVNRLGFSHEVPNLGVLGASVMGTSGARNPTLTAQALAWRTAEHLIKNWNAIKGSSGTGS